MSAATTQLRLTEVMTDLLARLESGELPTFVLDGQTVILEDYCRLFPRDEVRIKALVQAGKLHVGPWYTAPDEWLVSGESLIRNLERGMAEAMAYDQPAGSMVGYLPDTFGHTGDMPAILRHVGLTTAIVWRGVSSNATPAWFNWHSPDGSSVATYHLRQGYFHPALHDPNATDDKQQQAIESLVEQLSNDGDIPPLLPIGGDHLGALPNRGLSKLQQWYPQAAITTPADYMAQLPQPKQTLAGSLMDNTDTYLLTGVWSARPYLKQANKRCEHLLTQQLEPLLVYTWPQLTETHRSQYLAHLDEAWRLLLLNHPHDSICGCSTDIVHRENEVRFQKIEDIAQGCLKRLRSVNTHPSHNTEDITVWNGHPHAYTGVVPITAITQQETPPEAPHTQWLYSEKILQNGYETDPNQIPLSHLTAYQHTGWTWVNNAPSHQWHQVNSTQSVQYPVVLSSKNETNITNGLTTLSISKSAITINEQPLRLLWQPDNGDSYNRGTVTGEPKHYWAELIDQSTTIEGALITTQHTHWQLMVDDIQTTITITFTVKANSPLIELNLNWQHPLPNGLLQWVVDTRQPITEITGESHLGCESWPVDPDHNLNQRLPADKNKEVLPQSIAVQRWGMANDTLVVTDGPPELETVGCELRHSLLRTFDGISHWQTTTRGGPAGPPFSTPDAQYPNRPLHIKTAIGVGKFTPSKATLLADHFYTMADAHYATVPHAHHDKAISITWDNPAIRRLACQPVDGKTYRLRLVNTSHQTENVIIEGLTSPTRTIGELKQIDGNPRQQTYRLTLTPHQLISIDCHY
jgi:hypothetical protein